jgi:hypothetical protein
VLRGQVDATATFADGDIKVFARLQKPTGSTDSCAPPVYELTTKPHPSPPRTGGTTTALNTNHWLSQIGSAYDPGMPFGKYDICLVHKVGSVTKRYITTTAYDNTSATGDTPDLDLSPAWASVSGLSGYVVTKAACGF